MASILQFSHREFRTFVTDAIGVQYELPVIVTDNGVLDQFARYINRYRNKSRSWQESSTFAVQLLLEYMEVNQRFYDTPQALFREFSDALYSGTVSKKVGSVRPLVAEKAISRCQQADQTHHAFHRLAIAG